MHRFENQKSNPQRVLNSELATNAKDSYPCLVEQAKALAALLRERAAETNRLRRLPDATGLCDTGIICGLQPARWGGGELHPPEFHSAVIEVARAEGCAGWVAESEPS